MPADIKSVKGIIFDMDGVLCDSEPFICGAAVRMFREAHGVTVLPEDFIPFVGTGEDRYLGGVAGKYGVHLNMPADKTATYRNYLEMIKGRLKPLNGAKEFVIECRRRRLKTAIATSADRMKMDGNLSAIGLSNDTFDAYVFGEMIGRKKPFPDIFLKAVELLGLRPQECAVIEDAPNGIAAAQAAGTIRIGITSSFTREELLQAGAELTFRDLAEAMAVLHYNTGES